MDFDITPLQAEVAKQASQDAAFFTTSTDQYAASSGWSDAASRGWMGICIGAPSGRGMTALDTVMGFEALGKAGAERGALFATGAHLFGAAKTLEQFGTQSVCDRWLAPMAEGRVVGALAITEPSGGSNLTCESTVIERSSSGDFLLSGEKTFVTNAMAADIFIVMARDPNASAPLNLTMFAVPADTPGVTRAAIEGRGLSGAGMGRVQFEQCMVPEEHVLGRENVGMSVILKTMQWERTCILAGALGALDRDLEKAIDYLSTRRDASGPLTGHQGVSHPLVKIRCDLDAARLVMYRAAWNLDQGGDPILYPAQSKLMVAETLLNSAVSLQRLLGGAGWANEMGLMDAIEDALAMSAASGTSEVMHNVIASRIGLRQ